MLPLKFLFSVAGTSTRFRICNILAVPLKRDSSDANLNHFTGNGASYQKTFSRFMAGHAKWQNVKHIKAEKNRLKSHECNKFSHLVRLAVREKGPDPKINLKLATLLEQAKKKNVPFSTIENALKNAGKKKVQCGTVELLAPGGCFIIVDYETDNISTTRHDIKVLCKKYSVNVLSGEGRWRAAFEQKGIIKATEQLNGQQLDYERALDLAIEAGAEDVQQKNGEDIFFQFICEPSDLMQVKKELEKHYELEEAFIGFKPTAIVHLSEHDAKLTDNFMEELNNMQDVIRIYENT